MTKHPVVHFDIGCKNLEASRDFYAGVFGWSPSAYGPMSFKLDPKASKGIAGATTALGHEPHNYVMIYVEVDDIPAKLAEIESAGGSTVIPEVDAGEGWFAWFKDREGNLLGLWKPK